MITPPHALLTPMDNPSQASARFKLRQQAEAITHEETAHTPEHLKALSPEALEELVHELQVHQIELELQNEVLREAQLELNTAKQRYFDLYDLAPVSYLTVTHMGFIKQANLTASALLGLPRRALLTKPLSNFILNDELEGYYRFCKALIESNVRDERLTLELRMLNIDGVQFWAHLEACAAQDVDGELMLRITLTNITERVDTEIALRESVAHVKLLIDSALDGVIGMDQHGKVISWNRQAARIFGYSFNQALGRDFVELIVPPAYQEAHRQGITEFVKTGISTIINTRIGDAGTRFEDVGMRSDGSEFPMELSLSVAEQQEGYFFTAYVRDISERKQAEKALHIAAKVFEVQEGVVITDANSVIISTNQAFSNINGYTANELVGKNPSILKSGRQDADFYAAMWKAINETGLWDGEIWDRRKNGDIYPVHLTISSVKDASGIITNYVGTCTDISMSYAASDRIKYLALYDPLTDLPNRLLLRDRLTLALASSQRNRHGALLFIDLDHFKNLNDMLGHDIGDLLLQQVAERLTACVRQGDTVARLGGDEFVVLLEDLNESINEAVVQIEVIGNKILTAFSQFFQLATHHYHSTPSIGIAVFNGQKQSIDELLKHADIAMYSAKASGRNTLRFFDQHMQDSIAYRLAQETDLNLALNERRFELYYQPQVQSNQQITGAEALIRWHHPQRGLVSPVDFIPLAEEIGLILPMGHWVLETACAQIKRWEASEHTRDLTISVNVSARQFHQHDFVEQVHQVLQSSAINPKNLKLELTETVMLDNISEIIDKMNALRKLSVSFSMDDFGTGYSSLSYLSRLPLNQLKIDQSFVSNIGINASDAVIVQTIIGMAKNLNMEVIAEGVETEAQRDFLELNGCTQYQGYLFSKPVPIEQFEALLKKG